MIVLLLSINRDKLYRAFGNILAFAKTKTGLFIILSSFVFIPLPNNQHGPSILIAYIGILGFIILYKLDYLIRRQNWIHEHRELRLRQILSETHNATLLSLRHPLAYMPVSNYSMTPHNLVLLEATFHSKKPMLTVELGSGLSTHVLSSLIKAEGKGRVVSIDHNDEWIELTRRYLKHNGLSEFAEVIHAPLTKHAGDPCEWYDYKPYQNKITGIDLLVVDGPPAMVNETIREGALHHLYRFLNDGAMVFVDDAARIGEQRIVDNWRKTYPEINVNVYQTFAGACVITVCKK